MAKNNNGMRMKGNQMYRRPTKAMQQQYMRNQNNDIQLPELPTRKKLIIQHIIAGVIIIGISAALCFLVHWAFSFLGLVAVAVYLLMVGRSMNHKQIETFEKYIEMGMTKKMFIRQMQMKHIDQKQVDSALRMWDRAAMGDKFPRTFMDKLMGL